MKASFPVLRPSERWAALGFLLAASLAAAAAFAGSSGAAADGTGGPALRALFDPARVGPSEDFLRAPPFDPARRPLDGPGRLPTAEPMPVANAPPPLGLAGILVDGATGKVMFAGNQAWQTVGGSFAGWTIAVVEPRRVTLRRGDETRILDASDALRP